MGATSPADSVPRHLSGARQVASSSGNAAGSSRNAGGGGRSTSLGDDRDEDLDELLRDSVRLRLRADVPVGTYLSGGLDSSLITALAQAETDHQLRTFSIAFRDPRYDERAHQLEVAKAIGTRHHVVEAGPAEIADAFPDVIRHVEMPLVRTAPVPLFLLAREVRAQQITVVATGEGADELFWGYELFKEVVLRELSMREPRARRRAARTALRLSGTCRRAPRACVAPIPARDGTRRRGARFASHARQGDRRRQGLLPAGDRSRDR